MEAPGIVKLMYRNVKVNVDPGTLVILIGLPAMYLVFFGFGFGAMISTPGGTAAYLTFLTPGIMSVQCLMAGTVGGSMLWADRRWGMLAQLLVGPFTRLQYLLGIMFTSLLFGLAGAFVMLIGAFLIIGSLQVTLWGALTTFGVIALGSIFFGSLMLLIAGVVKSNNAYNSIQILILFVVNFASTVFYSFSGTLPLPIQVLFQVNPLTYVANAARGGFEGALPADAAWQLPLLLAETIVVLALATRVYVKSDVSFV
jgi:ABC-2 type transport system permease protein